MEEEGKDYPLVTSMEEALRLLQDQPETVQFKVVLWCSEHGDVDSAEASGQLDLARVILDLDSRHTEVCSRPAQFKIGFWRGKEGEEEEERC